MFCLQVIKLLSNILPASASADNLCKASELDLNVSHTDGISERFFF